MSKPNPNSAKSSTEAKESHKEQKSKGSNEPKNASATPSPIANVAVSQNRLTLFDHLPKRDGSKTAQADAGNIHPSVVKLGWYYKKGIIREDDDRVVALINAFYDIVTDYVTPPKKPLCWDLNRHIGNQVQYIVNCRQMSIGMGNFVKYLRFNVTQTPPDMSEDRAKEIIKKSITSYLEERIVYARTYISECCNSAIKNDDLILTFGSSPLVREILLHAAKVKQFQVIVVDSRPLYDGRVTLECLTNAGVSCTYTTLAGVGYVMKDATRVLLGASAVLSNGSVLAPAGTAMVAAIAKAHLVSVMFAAESQKFSYKVQMDSIVFNELGNPNEIAIPFASEGDDNSDGTLAACPQEDGVFLGAAENTQNSIPFSIINLRYDLTPVSNVSVIATEAGLIPPTSIPILIKELKQAGGQQGSSTSTTSPPAAVVN